MSKHKPPKHQGPQHKREKPCPFCAGKGCAFCAKTKADDDCKRCGGEGCIDCGYTGKVTDR